MLHRLVALRVAGVIGLRAVWTDRDGEGKISCLLLLAMRRVCRVRYSPHGGAHCSGMGSASGCAW